MNFVASNASLHVSFIVGSSDCKNIVGYIFAIFLLYFVLMKLKPQNNIPCQSLCPFELEWKLCICLIFIFYFLVDRLARENRYNSSYDCQLDAKQWSILCVRTQLVCVLKFSRLPQQKDYWLIERKINTRAIWCVKKDNEKWLYLFQIRSVHLRKQCRSC